MRSVVLSTLGINIVQWVGQLPVLSSIANLAFCVSWITGQNVQKLQILLFFAAYTASILKRMPSGLSYFSKTMLPFLWYIVNIYCPTPESIWHVHIFALQAWWILYNLVQSMHLRKGNITLLLLVITMLYCLWKYLPEKLICYDSDVMTQDKYNVNIFINNKSFKRGCILFYNNSDI